MTTVLHARPMIDRFIEMQSNLRRNKLHKMNHDSDVLEGSFNNRDNVSLIQFERKSAPLS